MSLTDHSVRIILGAVILVYVSVWVAGICTGKTAALLSILNAAAGLAIIGYWVVRQLQITQHIVEVREMAVLCFEVAVVAFSLYYLTRQGNSLMKAFTYAFFGVHLTALLLFLLYMTTFKLTKLF